MEWLFVLNRPKKHFKFFIHIKNLFLCYTLKNKVGLVSGGGFRNPESCRKRLTLEKGAKVANLLIFDLRAVQAVVDQIKKEGGEGIFIKAGFSKPDDNKRIVQEFFRSICRLDVALYTMPGIAWKRMDLTGDNEIGFPGKGYSPEILVVFFLCLFATQLEQTGKKWSGNHRKYRLGSRYSSCSLWAQSLLLHSKHE